MKIQSLTDLMVDMTRDLFDAEKQLVKALPKMAKAASSPHLRRAFDKHLEETKLHVERLQEVLTLLEQPVRGKKCRAMEGLLEEGKEILEMDGAPEFKDAAMIAAAQKVEHYEIASYGCLCTWAGILGQAKIKKILGDTLNEEKTTDALLTEVAETMLAEQPVASGGAR